MPLTPLLISAGNWPRPPLRLSPASPGFLLCLPEQSPRGRHRYEISSPCLFTVRKKKGCAPAVLSPELAPFCQSYLNVWIGFCTCLQSRFDTCLGPAQNVCCNVKLSSQHQREYLILWAFLLPPSASTTPPTPPPSYPAPTSVLALSWCRG